MALPNKTKIPVGTVLAGKYRITREIGRGGMAAVYEAENVDIGKRVAIKVLAQELTTSAIVVERFLREARAAAAIRSPYICDVYDSGKLDDGRPFLVLELLEGESLYERMTKIRFLDIESTIAIIAQTCRGLTKAHAASIVHRDLKPENIFLTRDEEGHLLAKILDFGLAKFYSPVSGTEQQARLTREGAVFGTPAYMSPEQVRGQGAVDQRADLWALGCIVYECLTGRTVWSTEQGVAMTFAQIANAPLPNPQQYRPDLADTFNVWFNKALDRDINRRFQTAKEFAEELAATFQQGRPSFSGMLPLTSLDLDPATPRPAVQAGTANENPFLPALRPINGGPRRGESGDTTTPAANETGAALADPTKAGSPSPVGPGYAGNVSPGPMAESPTSTRASKLGFVAPEPLDPAITGRPNVKSTRPLGRAVVIVATLAAVGVGGYAGWMQFIETPKTTLLENPATGSSTVPAPTSSSKSPQPTVSGSSALPWMPQIREAQQTIATGDLKAAARLLKDAIDKSAGHGIPRTMSEHLQVAMAPANDRAPCRLTGLARPRTYDLTSSSKVFGAGRPSITFGARGPVMIWTDAHEGAEHAYTVPLDEAMRNALPPTDVTPEGTQIGRPELDHADDKLVMTYWDAKGPEAGVKVRLLEADGRIGGPPVPVSPPSKGSSTFPSLTRASDGSFYVVWSNEAEPNSDDIFLRHLSPSLAPQGDALRVTDFVASGLYKPRARFPSLGFAGNALQLAFKLEREPQHLIQRLRLPLSDPMKGLEPEKRNAPLKVDRNIGDLALVNTDKAKGDTPSLACGASGCFLVWHGENNGGVWGAFIDPARAQPNWHKKFSKIGSRPAVAISASGQGQIVWFEPEAARSGRLMVAAITREVIGPATRIARFSGDQPTPSIVAGAKPGEWYVAWLDYEAGHLEAYGARVVCK
jgi:eukaryotic-like serine/threonine-protein kinase